MNIPSRSAGLRLFMFPTLPFKIIFTCAFLSPCGGNKPGSAGTTPFSFRSTHSSGTTLRAPCPISTQDVGSELVVGMGAPASQGGGGGGVVSALLRAGCLSSGKEINFQQKIKGRNTSRKPRGKA